MTERELTKIWAKVTGKFNALIDGAPEALNTLKKITDKLGDNDDALAGLLSAVADKADAANVYDKAQVDAAIAESSPVRMRATWNYSTNAYVSDESVDTMYDIFYAQGRMLELTLVNGNWNGLVLTCRGGHTEGNVRHMVFGGVGMGMIIEADVVDTAVTVVYDSTGDIWDELGGKQDALVSGQNIKSINGQSVLGAGNLELGELFVVTITRHNSVYTADKSVSEIYEASYTNGKPVIAVMRDINNPVFILTDCDPDADSYVFSSIESNVVTTLRWQQTDEYTYELETILLQPKFTYGSTSDRPILALNNTGYQYFDTDLGKPIYWNGSTWIDATGTVLS